MCAQTPQLRPFLAGLEPYVPGEQLDGQNITKLNTNESPYPPPQRVLDALGNALDRLRFYPNPTSAPLREAIAAYHGVAPDQVLAGNGSDEILRLLIHACISPGDAIAVVDPTYSLYTVLSEIFEGGTTVYPLVGRFELPEALFTAPEPLLLLPNPNPPIGTLYGREQVAALCRARADRLVVIDEAYVDFATQDVVPLLGEFQNLAVTRTLSKSSSLAGMRVGYLLADAAVVAEIMKLKDSYNLSHLAQTAGLAAIEAVDEVHANAAKIIATRETTVAALRDLGYDLPESHGNFVFALHPEAKSRFLALRERGILVRYFDKPGLRDGMRITIGLPEEMDRLIEALKDIHNEKA